MKHYTIRVTGTVQGVFYRKSTRAKAKDLGLTGFVRNEPDGSVYMEAEGEKSRLDALVSWCWQGPPAASVQDVSVEEGPLRQYANFELRYA